MSDPKKHSSLQIGTAAAASAEDAPPALQRGRSAHRERGEVGQGAEPTNRAPNNCNESFQLLRLGVDSLYLSFPGKLSPEVDKALNECKRTAQSTQWHEVAGALYHVGKYSFHVSPKGSSLFPYTLWNARYRINLASSNAQRVPMAYVQISSQYLSYTDPEAVVDDLMEVIKTFGALDGDPKVSRVDLFVDFQSDVKMDGWGRESWVTRASSVNSYSVNGQFSGWTFGLGGVLGGRLYNKTLEIHSSHKDFFHEIWRECGYDRTKPVWRLEFEFKREILQQYGLVGHLSVLDALGSLWAYATGDWLRLSIPLPEDDTRSRWPTHPLWECLSGVDWKTPPVKLQTRFKLGKLPSEKYLLNTGFSSILGFMVREEIGDFVVGSEAYLRRLTSFQTNKAFADGVPFEQYVYEKLLYKARQYNVILDIQNPTQGNEETALRKAAEAYRRESDGQ